MRIHWNDLNPAKFEELVGLLLRRKYGARPIDGSGGDGGRDAHFQDEAGYHIFQFKAFLTGRLSQGGRMGQLTRSFDAAAKHQPDSWTLILGIVPTVKEGEWLDKLGAASGISVVWHGRDWLESELAKYPDIVRYFTEDATKQLLREMGNLEKMEQASLQGGVPAVHSRLQDFAKQVDELSPHYKVTINIDRTNVTVGLAPKYEGAEKDYPLTFNVEVTQPRAAKEFSDAMARLSQFGAPLELSGDTAEAVTVTPSSILGEQFQPKLMRVMPGKPTRRFAIRAVLVGDDGVDVATQKMEVTHTGRGSKGFSLRAENETRTLALEIDLDFHTQTLHFYFYPTVTPGVSPAEMANTFAWIDELHNGREVQVWEADRGVLMFSGKGAELGDSPALRDRQLLENLARIQDHAGVHFPVPEDMTVEDVYWIDRAIELLDTGKTEVRWSKMTVGVTVTGDVDDLLAPGRQMILDNTPIRMQISGHEVELGVGRIHLPDVAVANEAKVRSDLQVGAETNLRLVPGTTDQPYVLQLVSERPNDAQAS